MLKAIIALCAVSGGTHLWASNISTSFSCYVQTSPSTEYRVTSSTPCAFSNSTPDVYGVGPGSADAGGSYNLPNINGPTNTFFGSESVYASSTPRYDPATSRTYGALATATISWSTLAITAGPVRPGIMKISSDPDQQSFSSFNGSSIMVGDYSCTPLGSCGAAFAPRPFTLGVPFTISLTSLLWSERDDQFPGGYTINVSTTFSFYEADGTTPVTFSATPEPAEMAPLALGLCLMAWRKRRSAAVLGS